MKTLSDYFIISLAIFFTVSCTPDHTVLTAYAEEYPAPNDSTLISTFIGHYTYTYPIYTENYHYDSKKRLALVHASRVDGYIQAPSLNDSMFIYYNGDDSLPSKIITKHRDNTSLLQSTTFILGYNASRQVIFDTLYGYLNDLKVINYNTYTYLPGGVIKIASGTIQNGVNYPGSKTAYTFYDSQKRLTKQIFNNEYETRLKYGSTISPYYKALKLNYGFLPRLLPLGLSGPGFGSTRFSTHMIVNDTAISYPSSLSTVQYSFVNRTDGYPLSFDRIPHVSSATSWGIINYGNFYYY
jgi:hypothetical protein